MKKIKNKKKKGFTLIELLVVISVLAILIVFVAPKVVKVFDKNKREMFVTEAKTILKESEAEILLNSIGKELPSSFNSVDKQLDVKSKLKYQVDIIDKKVSSICVTNGDYSINISGTLSLNDIKASSIKEGDLCGSVESPVVPNVNCFSVVSGAIKDYYDNEANNSSNPVCPRSIEIPSVIGGNTIITLDSLAFYQNNMSKIIIPSTVTTINSYALSGNSLKSVTLPEGLTTLGAGALYDNELTSVTIPTGVTTIGYNAFALNKLKSIVIPNGVTSIGGYAFSYNEIESVSFPNTLTKFYDYAFRGNHIKSLTIPLSVTNMGLAVFNDNDLPEESAFIYERNDANSDGVAEVDTTHITSYGGLIRDGVNIPDGAVYIDQVAFQALGIKSVNFPSSLKNIGVLAFYQNEITDITIPSTIIDIAPGAFSDNSLPDNKAFIYKRTDTNLDGVSEIDLSYLVSYGGLKREGVVIPPAVTTIGERAFYEAKIKSISMSEGVTSILKQAFYNDSLAYVKIPSTVEHLGSWCFEGNPLTSVCVVGKSSTSDFTVYNEDDMATFSWAFGYDDGDIIWNCTN